MYDPRFDKLADVLVRHSTKLQDGETILLEAIDVPHEMVVSLIRKIRAAGGRPMVTVKSNVVQRELIGKGDETIIKQIADYEKYRMEKVQAYIALRGSHNISELSDVPADAMRAYQQHWWKPVHIEVRVPKTKWVVLRWPSSSMAQQAQKSTEAFEDFYFDVCTLDYAKMEKAAAPLKALMQKTDQVHIKGPGTDLTFSIKGINVLNCAGTHNIPDGECYTSPVRDSANGTIQFNAGSNYQGTTFSDVKLTLKNGKVVEATANHTEKINEILDTDEGARYIGEFALGFNPHITFPMLDILFDEKIAGSLHFTPGNAYEDADNGNRSSVHWDLVLIQTPEYGGGEIHFDGKLIRKDGLFVHPELEGLNPENLK
ncbi:MAG TPA: aminopeptidase [bacterium]